MSAERQTGKQITSTLSEWYMFVYCF